jgi:hypothetical protein
MWRVSSAGNYASKMPHPAGAFNTIFCGFDLTEPHLLVDKSGK